MCLKSSMAEKRGPHKDCPLVEALRACAYVHAHRHKHMHTHHDAWARVRTGNLAKDTGGDGACAHVAHTFTRIHTKHRVHITKSKPNCTLAAPLHSYYTHVNTQPLLYLTTMRSDTHVHGHTHMHTSRAP